MNRYAGYSIACFGLGIVLFFISASLGEGRVYVLPFVFVGTGVGGVLSVLGGLCLIFGFMFAFLAFSKGRIELVGFDDLEDWERDEGTRRRPEGYERGKGPMDEPRRQSGSRIKGGGVVFIGPIPIIFGSDQRLTIVLVILAIIIMVLAFLFMSGALI